MKKIIKYRIIWEDGANPNYVGPKTIEIEAPHFLNIKTEFKGKDLFGKRRIECDYYDTETKETGTHILYREHDTNPAGLIKYRSFNSEGGEIHKCESDLRRLRDECLDSLGDCIFERHKESDFFSVDPMPEIFAENFAKKEVQFVVKCDEKYFDIAGFYGLMKPFKDLPFGIAIFKPTDVYPGQIIYKECSDTAGDLYALIGSNNCCCQIFVKDLKDAREYALRNKDLGPWTARKERIESTERIRLEGK